MRKRATDRYASVEALSADIRAHLDGFPVVARRGGRWYRLRRFLGRHRLAFVAGAVVLIVATLGAVSWLRQYRATIEQQSRADQMTALILQAIEAADPSGGNAGNLKVRELFQRIFETAMSDPAVLAEQPVALLAPLAKIQSRLELSAEALQLIEHVDVRSLSGAEQQLILRARADALLSLGRFKEAESLVKQGLALAYDSESLSEWKLTEAFVDHKLGRASESLAKLQSISLVGLSRKLRIEVLQQRARVYLDTGMTDKAREALQIVMGQMDHSPENNMALLGAHSELYELNLRELRFKDAEHDLLNQLSVIEQIYGKNSYKYVTALVKQADLLARMEGKGDRYRAVSVRMDAMNRFQYVFGLYHPDMAKLEFDLAIAHLQNGNAYHAMLSLETAIIVAEKVCSPSDYNLLMIRSSYAARLVLESRFAEARTHAERALASAGAYTELRSSPHYLLAILVVAIADFQQAPSQRGRDGVVNAYRAFADSKSTPSVQVMTRELPAVITQLGITLE